MPELDIGQLALQARHLDMLRTILRQHLPMAEVWAFGSRINGAGHEASDLDLIARNPLALSKPLQDMSVAREVLIESNLPIRVDLQDWALLPESFRQEIERQYVVLQLAEKTAA